MSKEEREFRYNYEETKTLIKMKKLFCISLLLLASCFYLNAEVTIEQCVDKAFVNYPSIKKYDLLSSTCEIELSDINKGWLPSINIYGQATVQNVVPSFPDMLSGMLENMGQQVDGLGKIQYKIGADMSQTIWDGGNSKARRALQRANSATQKDVLDVELYAVRERVENIYFAILLTEEQIAQNNSTLELIGGNLEKLQSMFRNGTAMQSDVDMIEAQRLVIKQNIANAKSAVKGYRKMLEIFIGESLQDRKLTMPDATMPAVLQSDRPELKLFESRLETIKASQRLSDTSLMPKIGLFAQAYYGYPGFDYFKSMMNRDLSFNVIAGVKVSWNIDSFYTKKNVARRSAIEADNILAYKKLFLFNSDIKTASQMENIEGLRDVIADDEKIVQLRASVRKAAESQLANGVIDMTGLLTKITDENQANLAARFHEIQLIQEIYNLKYTINR